MSRTIEELTKTSPDEDLALEEFISWLHEHKNRFEDFYKKTMAENPSELKSAQTRTEWMEEFNAYIDTLDGERD